MNPPQYGPDPSSVILDPHQQQQQQQQSFPTIQGQTTAPLIRPLAAKNCCTRFFLTTRLLIVLSLAVAFIGIGILMFSLSKNRYPGTWETSTCKLPPEAIIAEPARFYNPCKHGFVCNLCKIQNTKLVFEDPYGTVVSTDLEVVAHDITEAKCLSPNSSREFKCVYQTRRTSRKVTDAASNPSSPDTAGLATTTTPSTSTTGLTAPPTPTTDPDNANIFHYPGFDLELYPHSHFKIDDDTFRGQRGAAIGVIVVGAFFFAIYLLLVLQRWLQSTFYSCRFCSIRYCFTWCIFTCIFPNEKSKLHQYGEKEQLWKGMRSSDVVVLDESSRYLQNREGELHIDTSSDDDLLADDTDKIVGTNKMNIPRPQQINPLQLPGGLQPFSLQQSTAATPGQSVAGSMYNSAIYTSSTGKSQGPGTSYTPSHQQQQQQQFFSPNQHQLANQSNLNVPPQAQQQIHGAYQPPNVYQNP